MTFINFFPFHVRFKYTEIATNGMVGAELWDTSWPDWERGWAKRLRHLFCM